MSESEDRKELGGLARSIDSLFATPAKDEPPTADPGSSGDEIGGPDGDAAAFEGSESTSADSDEAAAPDLFHALDPDSAGGVPVAQDPAGGGSDVHDADGVLPATPEPMAGLEVGADDADAIAVAAPEAGDPGALDVVAPGVSDPTAAEVAAPEAADPGGPEIVATAMVASDAFDPSGPHGSDGEPTPLELAVESYLVGGVDGGRIVALAEHHLEAREFDPVASSVLRLVTGSDGVPTSEAMDIASKLLTPIVRGRLVHRLGQERDEGRRHAYHTAFEVLGEDMALAIRDEMADATDRSQRRAYFDALVAMGDVARPTIEAMAEDDNRFLARNGVAILGEIGGPRAVELVVSALANTDPRVRREGLLAMARLRVEDADQLVTGLLEDSDESVRLAAVVAAGELGVERAVRPLVAVLEEAYEPDTVLPVLHALGQISDPGAVPAIEKHAVKERFGKPRTQVRIAAYQALNHIGTPHARRLLNQAVSDKDPAVKSAVKDLLHMR